MKIIITKKNLKFNVTFCENVLRFAQITSHAIKSGIHTILSNIKFKFKVSVTIIIKSLSLVLGLTLRFLSNLHVLALFIFKACPLPLGFHLKSDVKRSLVSLQKFFAFLTPMNGEVDILFQFFASKGTMF